MRRLGFSVVKNYVCGNDSDEGEGGAVLQQRPRKVFQLYSGKGPINHAQQVRDINMFALR